MAKLRTKPYIWVTSLAKAMVGDTSCMFSPWFAAHYESYKKVQRPFDSDGWLRDHTALLRILADRYRQAGYVTRVEDQNWLRVKGARADVGAKPDLMLYDVSSERLVTIVDAKTGQPKDRDRAQVKLYMWLWSLLDNTHKPVGRLVYSDSQILIEPDEIDSRFIKQATDTIGLIAGDRPATRPSFRECSWCDITKVDCSDRVEEQEQREVLTEMF